MNLMIKNRSKFGRIIQRDYPLYLMLIPGALFFIIFKYIPMYGVVMAFQNFRMARGFLRSEFIGFANFQKVFGSAFFPVVMWNTVLISLYKIIIGFPFPIILAAQGLSGFERVSFCVSQGRRRGRWARRCRRAGDGP